MDGLEGKFGNRGEFETTRDYSDDLMSKIGKFASEKIKKGGKEAEEWKRGLEMISLLLEEGIIADEIIKQSEIVLQRIESGEIEEVKKTVAEIRKKAEWVFDASKKLRTREGEVQEEIRSALAAIEEALRKSEV